MIANIVAVTYSISGETQAPATMNQDELATLREMAAKNSALKILKVRTPKIRANR